VGGLGEHLLRAFEANMLPLLHQLKYLHLAYFSKPVANRPLYRHVRRQHCSRILELGIGSAHRAKLLIELASRANPEERVIYTGIDLFESRSPSEGSGISLKLAHRELATTGAKVRLVPGNPYDALLRSANMLGPHDLVLISADQDRESLSRAWFYMPRVVAEGGQVFVEKPIEGGGFEFHAISQLEIAELARGATRRRAA
jgi:hypothetical protein